MVRYRTDLPEGVRTKSCTARVVDLHEPEALRACARVDWVKQLHCYRGRFVRQYPDLRVWVAAPLPERVGKLL